MRPSNRMNLRMSKSPNSEQHNIKRVCVFCGSSAGLDPQYAAAARALGRTLGVHGIDLVYGGASVGLMGIVADAALEYGCGVTGVIPESLVRQEVAHTGLDDLRVVGSMHERKALMAELSDAFVALPGGLGTLEEIFEVWTWAQLGHHRKACALLNVGGYYDDLLGFLETVETSGFLKARHRQMLIVADEPEALLDGLDRFIAPSLPKWI